MKRWVMPSISSPSPDFFPCDILPLSLTSPIEPNMIERIALVRRVCVSTQDVQAVTEPKVLHYKSPKNQATPSSD